MDFERAFDYLYRFLSYNRIHSDDITITISTKSPEAYQRLQRALLSIPTIYYTSPPLDVAPSMAIKSKLSGKISGIKFRIRNYISKKKYKFPGPSTYKYNPYV